MTGAYRRIVFERPRYGSFVRLSEAYSVDTDNAKKLCFHVAERNPRRGFSVRVLIELRVYRDDMCEANIIAEVRPVGKDMSNQAAVHKAFLLVLEEIKVRYAADGNGLLAIFLSVVNDMNRDKKKTASYGASLPRLFSKTGPDVEEKKTDTSLVARANQKKESGLVSFSDILQTSRASPETLPSGRPSTPTFLNQPQELNSSSRTKRGAIGNQPLLEEVPVDSEEAAIIEVKPLPKIPLSLMPSPREEDEENASIASSPMYKPSTGRTVAKSKVTTTSSPKRRWGTRRPKK